MVEVKGPAVNAGRKVMSKKATGKARFLQPAGVETAHPLSLRDSPRRPQNFLEYFVKMRLVLFQFGAHKRMEIVSKPSHENDAVR